MPVCSCSLQVISATDRVAVLGDGKLGLLVAQALVLLKEVKQLTHFGRYQDKLRLVEGTQQVIVDSKTAQEHNQVVYWSFGSMSLSVASCACLACIVYTCLQKLCS